VLTRSNPVLMIFEDAHWTDPSSLELLGRTVDRIATHRVLLIVTFRPEFEPPWIGRPYVTALTINRLGHREVGAMIDSMIGNNPLPASVRQDIIEHTDGIPLFVEEMTKAVLETENEGQAKQSAAAVPWPALAVPASLHASLMARLDRLGSAKEVAQIGSAISREFSHPILAAVVRKSEAELGSALDRLIAAGLLFRQGVPPHATYLFKHALVQDAAYGTLLREPRRALHALIAEALESQFPEIAESQPELLARHCTEAGMSEKAAGLWGKAGRLSLERSALVEAAQQLARAIELIGTLTPTPARRYEQIRLQVALLTPLIHVKGYTAPETKAAAKRARLLIEQAEALGESLEDPLLLFSVLHASLTANYVAFNGDVMRELAAYFLALAEKQGSAAPLVVGHHLMGTSLMTTGSMLEGRAHFDRALALYDPVEHRPLATRFGQDIGVTILGFRSLCLWFLGYREAALIDAERAVTDARKTLQAVTLLFALYYSSLVHAFCGNYTTASRDIDELIALAHEKDALTWKANGMVEQGLVFALTGKAMDAIQALTNGLSARRLQGATNWIPLFSSCLGRTYVEIGQFNDARNCITEALTAIRTTNERWFEAEVNRVAGEMSLLLPEADAVQAEAHFDFALAIAREQQAKSWELRAAMSLARLWRDQGKVHQARELLAPVYGWFTEGFDTRDLKEAKALLSDLSS
jgi:predicted ATPase